MDSSRRNRIRKKSIKRSSSSSATNNNKRSRRKMLSDFELRHLEIYGLKPSFSRPFKIGFYSPGTEPDRIPYHLYLLVKEAVDLINVNSACLEDLNRVEKKISFFCDFFYSHLPLGWEYDRDNATSLIAGYDTKGDRPKYNITGFAPLGGPISKNEFDYKTQLHVTDVFEIMSIIHSRKTPTPETFMQWNEYHTSFYCKMCSCFGIDYQRLEAASQDDVLLLNTGTSTTHKRMSIMGLGALLPNNNKLAYKKKRRVEKISSSNKDATTLNYMFKRMRKLSSSDEAFQISKTKILEILRVIHSRRLPSPTMFARWNEYQISFYCKMCSCFGIDYHRLEAAAAA